METVKLIIDRKPVEVPKGTTILDAAKGMGAYDGGCCIWWKYVLLVCAFAAWYDLFVHEPFV